MIQVGLLSLGLALQIDGDTIQKAFKEFLLNIFRFQF